MTNPYTLRSRKTQNKNEMDEEDEKRRTNWSKGDDANDDKLKR